MNKPENPTRGRNDPCRCGSGKKYKNCHLRADERAASLDLMVENLIDRVSEFAIGPALDDDFHAAYEILLRRKFEVPDTPDAIAAFQSALDYFVYDYTLPDGRRVIERFLAEHGRRLTADEREIVEGWQEALLAAFEVISVDRGTGMRLRDIFSEQEFYVLEDTGTQDLNRWEILVTRLLPVGDHYEPSAFSGLRLSARLRDRVRSYLVRQWAEYQWDHAGAPYETFMHAASHDLFHFITGEMVPDEAASPTVITAEGDVSEIGSMDEALARRSDAPREVKPKRDARPEFAAAQTEIVQIQRQWLDEPIPMLQDRSPREAVTSFAGRVRVIRLIKEIEASAPGTESEGEIPFPVDAVKAELGIRDQELIDESQFEDRMRQTLNEIAELADEERLDAALAAWRGFRQRYPLATLDELDFAEMWNLQAVLDETVDALVYQLGAFKRYDEGIALLEEILALDPEDPTETRAAIAELRAERGDTEQALGELQALVTAAPDHVEAVITLAEVQRDLLDRADVAIETLRHGMDTVAAEWRDDLVGEIVDTYLEIGRAAEAEQIWHQVNDNAEEKDYASLTQILLAYAVPDWESARSAANKIAEEPARQHWLGQVEAQAGNPDLARQLWAGDLEEPDSKLWEDWSTWVEKHLLLRDFDLVIDKFDPVRLHATAAGYIDLALAHAAKGDWPRAAELAREGRTEMERSSRKADWPAIRHDTLQFARDLDLAPLARQALQI